MGGWGGGGKKPPPPRLIMERLSSGNAPNGLIFHDFVPFNIRKVLGRPFLQFLFEIYKISYVNNFSTYNPKGGPFYVCENALISVSFFWSKMVKMVIIQLQMH